MSWFDRFKKQPPAVATYAKMLNGYNPQFAQFGNNIYASDVVQQAISCIVSEMKKLNPQHIRQMGADVTTVSGSIQTVLQRPNEFMTTSEFIEKVIWQLFFNYNSFIIPTFYIWNDKKDGSERRQYTGLYPIQPQQVDFIEDASGTMYVKFSFANGYKTTLLYSDVIHIKYRYSVNEFMGGNAAGQPDNAALLQTLNLNYQLLQGVAKAMKMSFAVNGIVNYKTMLDKNKTKEALQEFEEKLTNNQSGILPLDITESFTPIQNKIQLVDADTLKFIDEKILRHFGVPLCILSGDYTKAQYEAFYQKTLEPLIISISQAFTKTLFTDRELSFGNKVQFYPKDLIFMSVDQTLEMVRLLGDSGSLYENEKRVAFGLKPLPELEGVRMQSLNYVNIEYARQYQTQSNTDTGTANNSEGGDNNAE